jgi:hypothetical protein
LVNGTAPLLALVGTSPATPEDGVPPAAGRPPVFQRPKNEPIAWGVNDPLANVRLTPRPAAISSSWLEIGMALSSYVSNTN